MKHEYLTLNGKVVYEKIGEGSSAKIMIFSYDALGRPFAVKYSKNNGAKFTNYFYALNQQGDVVKIFRPVAVTDANGNTTGYTEKTYATYTYDAWGKLTGILDSGGNNLINKQTTSTALANLNPLRYRGYYYDNETGFYYLQSRYYDPAVKRFINADNYLSTDIEETVACNMFAYCLNNPVNYSDYTGSEAVIISIIIGSLLESLGTLLAIVGVITAILFVLDGVHEISEATKSARNNESKERTARGETIATPLDRVGNLASDDELSLDDIASRYGLYECQEAAFAMAKRGKKGGYLIKLEFNNAIRGCVLAPTSKYGNSKAISQNGSHWGYCDQNHIVRCNVFPMGLPEDVWIHSFTDFWGSEPTVIRIPLP